MNSGILYIRDSWYSKKIISHQVCGKTSQDFAYGDSGDKVNVQRSQEANDMQRDSDISRL